MKKNLMIALAISSMMFIFSACGNPEVPEDTLPKTETEILDTEETEVAAEDPGRETEVIIEEPGRETEIAAVQPERDTAISQECDVFLDFMNGNGTVTTDEIFKEDDEYYNNDGLLYGQYSYPELKVAIEKMECNDSMVTRYAFVDCNGDGNKELALRFDSTIPSLTNWIGIVCHNEGKLKLTYAYEDGYRTESTLYESGMLKRGGSSGAGVHGMDYLEFDQTCKANCIFSYTTYYGNYVSQIAYHLFPDDTGLIPFEEYYLDAESMLEVTELIQYSGDQKDIKLYVTGYSEDVQIREQEEHIIEKLVAAGAQLVSHGEMEEMSAINPGTQVQWRDREETCTIVKAAQIDYYYGSPDDYESYVLSESEFATDVVVSTNKKITDVSILSLTVQDSGGEGQMMYSAQKVATIDAITMDRPLKITMEFAEYIPNYGISYTDENDEQIFRTICLSGYDDSVFLSDGVLAE